MTKTWKKLLTACLFFGLALILASCCNSGKNGAMEGKMGDTTSGSMEKMEKEMMKDSMESLENKKMEKESMQETMN